MFAEAVAHPDGAFARVTGVSCSSLRACDVAWQDPIEHLRFRQRHTVAGERAAGCWIAQRGPIEGSAPHLYPPIGNTYYVGGCVRWPV